MSSRDSAFYDQQFLWQPDNRSLRRSNPSKTAPRETGANLLNNRFHLRTLFLAERLPKLMERDVL
jgi:hypothetical protein